MKQNILLIDDDREEIELLTEVVGQIDPNTECRFAFNGREAMELLENEFVQKPAFIFLDINMPIMNGWEFLTKIKSIDGLNEIPVIVYSTSNREHDRATARTLGASQFINKPEDYQLLKKELADLLLRFQHCKASAKLLLCLCEPFWMACLQAYMLFNVWTAAKCRMLLLIPARSKR